MTIHVLAASEVLSSQDIFVLLISIATLLAVARVLSELARRWKQPSVLGEIFAGIVLGPTVLGALWPLFHGLLPEDSYLAMKLPADVIAYLFPDVGNVATARTGLIQLSAALLLLAAGMEVDLSTVWRQGKAMLCVGSCSLVVPFGLGLAIAWLFWFPQGIGLGDKSQQLPFALFAGIAMSITALPVIAKILIDLNLSKSDLGMLIISSAMFNDVVGWIGFAIVLALMAGPAPEAVETMQGAVDSIYYVATGTIDAAAGAVSPTSGDTEHMSIGWTVGLTIGFIVGMITVGRLLFHKMLPYVQARWSYPGGVLAFVFVVAFLCAAFTEKIGVHSIFGAFIAGVAMGDSHHLRHRTRENIHHFIMNIFAPLFFASIGLSINFFSSFTWQLVLVVLTVAVFGKVTGCFAGAKIARLTNREGLAVGFGMAAQGTMGIILGQLALDAELINQELMVAIVFMAIVTSLLAGPLMQKTLKLRTKRTLVDVLSDRQIVTQVKAHDAQSAIAELADRAAELTGLTPTEIYEKIWQREQLMHTGLPHGIAVPHARFKNLRRPLLLLGRSPNGVDFDASDGSAARLLCMILTPEDDPNSQIEMLQLVAVGFEDEATRAQVLGSATTTEVLAALNLSAAEKTDHTLEHDKNTLGA